MTKYQEFIETVNDSLFVDEIHKGEIPTVYRCEDIKGITLEELEELDDKFIKDE